MGLYQSRFGRQFLLQAPSPVAVVFRQHRISPHSPFERPHPELSFGKMSPRRTLVSNRQASHPVRQFQIARLPPLGRTTAQADWLSCVENHSYRARRAEATISMMNKLIPPSHPEPFMMPVRKSNPRVEYRLRQNQLVKDSISLGEKFPKLKALTV